MRGEEGRARTNGEEELRGDEEGRRRGGAAGGDERRSGEPSAERLCVMR